MNNLIKFITRNSILLLLLIVVLLGGFLRFYRLREFPVSNYWDGVAFSYNAFSILHTGKDEYGRPFPLLFKSFDDYKMPANIYVTVPYVAIWGLNGFSTRGSTATAGTLLVLITFFLVKEFLENIDTASSFAKKIKQRRSTLALLASFFVAISPWAIQFSRAEFEANVGIPFILGGVLFFLKGIRVNSWKIFLIGIVSFAISVYFYRSIIFFTPAILFTLCILFARNLWKNKTFLVLLATGILLAAPMYVKIFSKEGLIRSQQVSVFTNSFNQTLTLAKKQEAAGNTLVSRIVYNRRIVYAQSILQNYLSNLSPNFFFFQGDPNSGRHGPRGMGLLYIWEIPFILIGLLSLWKLKGNLRWIIFLWIFLAPIPAAISIPNPHALRTLNMLPIPQILTALGVLVIALYLKGKRRYIYATCLSISVIIFFILYLQNFYGYSAKVTSADWADGYKQLYSYLFKHDSSYERVIVSGHYWKPYIYYLYYKDYNPEILQKHYSQTHIDKYLFGGTKWEHDQYELEGVDLQKWAGSRDVLVALSPDEYDAQKSHVQLLLSIYNHNGELVFLIGKLL